MDKMRVFQTWKVLLKILILELLFLTAYSPSKDHTISTADPHGKAVCITYSPSPQTTTNLPSRLCLKLLI